jgi:sarcosine oxidase, subunit delta
MRELHCPNCGGRSRDEFRFGGELPTVPDSVTEPNARNIDYVWFFDNIDGPSTERWFHDAGCRRWFTAQRDTRRDVVLRSPGDDHG